MATQGDVRRIALSIPETGVGKGLLAEPAPPGAVVFDLDGVLYDFHPEARANFLAARTGRDPESIAALFRSAFESRAEAGAYATGSEYLDAFNQILGSSLSRQEWIEARRVAMHLREGMVDLVTVLSQRLMVGMLTNNGALLQEALPELVGPLWGLIGPRCWVSCEFGARKPDPLVYRRMAERLGLPPATILFIDDSAANCEGARAAGLAALRFLDVPHTLAALGFEPQSFR